MPSNWSRIIGAFILFSGMWVSMVGQNTLIRPTNNSPFSRFGMGNFADQYTAMQAGMAGLTAAFPDQYHLNFQNPASLGFLQLTSFEVGVAARYSALTEQDNKENLWSGSLNYLALGFPLINPVNKVLDRDQTPLGIGMSFSLRPYTSVGYNILTDIEVPELGPTQNSFKGSGSTYRLMWGNGIRYKNLAFGFNAGAIFGKLINSRRIEFDSLSVSYATEFQDETSVGGWLWEAGLMYVLPLSKVEETSGRVRAGEIKRLVFGINGSSTNYFTTNSSSYQRRDNLILGDIDTIFSERDVLRQAVLPTQLNFGVTFEKVNQLRLGLEYSMGLWSDFRSESLPANYDNTWRIAFGGEYIPDFFSFNSYFDKVRYRFGAFYGTDPRVFSGQQLENYGLTFGFGFPMIKPRETISYFDIAFELGQFGVSDLLQETYFKVTMGFALNDNSWFFKRKFN